MCLGVYYTLYVGGSFGHLADKSSSCFIFLILLIRKLHSRQRYLCYLQSHCSSVPPESCTLTFTVTLIYCHM